MKPLDLVKTKKGSLALVKTVTRNGNGTRQCDIQFIEPNSSEHNAWYQDDELTYVSSLPLVLIKAVSDIHCNDRVLDLEDV